MGGLRETLKEAVRQLAFRTSLASLKKKGVQKVNVLGIDRIVALIEAAVQRSLKSRLLGADREAVAAATKAEFLRLLRTNEDLQRQKSEWEQQKEQAEEEIDQLRRDLAQQNRSLQQRLEQDALENRNRYDGENALIARKVADVMQAIAGNQGMSAKAAEEKVMELVMDVVSGEREDAEHARRALQDRDVENLQRRIKKLSETLQQTEQRLQHVAATKNIESGISSLYREVQGVSLGDVLAHKKSELMAEIFKANLELQKRTGKR
ncbi:MAG TPA: hypothetical protein VFD82_13540 [Planctomycetota bacterium]|nr:hypothetical protein [Planctomycetota bacterium]